MVITRRADYALRALIFMAAQPNGATVTMSDMAREQKIPRALLYKILQGFVQDGLVRSYRGHGGGYKLTRPAEEITVRRVVETVDGAICIHECLDDNAFCHLLPNCSLSGVFVKTRQAVLQSLESVTVADCVRPRRSGEPCAARACS